MALLRCQSSQLGLDFSAKPPPEPPAPPSPIARAMGRTDYEERRTARIERQKTRAERLRRVAEAKYARAREISDYIPMGQPILVGHHSERKHRRDIARIESGYRQSFEAQKQAEDLERRAASAERSTAVSSDDPNAVERLREKLAEAERHLERLHAANKVIRRNGKTSEIIALLGPQAIDRLSILHSMGQKTYPTTNAAADIRRIKARIAELEKRASTPVRATENIGTVAIEEADNRVKLRFPGKPSPEVIRELKGSGFHWSRHEGVWQRMSSNQAWYHARRIAERAR